MNVGSALLMGLFLAIAAPSSHAAQRALTERLAECARETSDPRRLACFDRETAHLIAPSNAESSYSAANIPADAKDDFGASGGEVARRRSATRENKAAEPRQLSATVTAIERQPRGELVLTLDNGQIWTQKTAQSYFPVKIGDPVTITAGALGSFRLAAGGRSTKVTRVE